VAAAVSIPHEHAEQRILLYGISWKDYCVLRELLDSPRMTYACRDLRSKPARQTPTRCMSADVDPSAFECNVHGRSQRDVRMAH